MFFTERVLGVDGKFFAALQDVCEFFDDKFELLTGEFRTQPDNKTRYLIHGFALHGHYNNAFAGGRQVNLLKLFKNKEDKKIKSKNFWQNLAVEGEEENEEKRTILWSYLGIVSILISFFFLVFSVGGIAGQMIHRKQDAIKELRK